jgi:predicted permease
MLNVKMAFRMLFRTPFVTVIAVLSLALGIGANAAIFSLFNQMLLRPLPVAHPERLVNLAAPGPSPGSNSCNEAGDCTTVFSYPMFRDLQAAHTDFSAIAAHRLFAANVAYRKQTPLNGDGMYVSGSYFQMLGLTPALGRLITRAEDQTIGGSPVAVLGYAFWQTHLGGDPSVINQPIVVNGQSLTIIGVAPRGFEGTTLGNRPTVYVPITMKNAVTPKLGDLKERKNYWVYVFARLAPGVTMDQAAAAINAAYHPIMTDVEAPLQKGMSAATLGKFKAKKVVLEDGRRGQSQIHGQVRTPMILLFSITAIVLLIACANIANLLLARSANRSTEMAVRLSLGGTRGQLMSQLLTESCLLAALGGLASLVVARLTLGMFVALLPPDSGEALTFTLQWPVVAFAAALSIGTGFLFGIVPALQSTRPDLVTTLRAGSGKLAGERGAARFRTSLVTAQIALSMALLVAAGLFVKSLMNVSRVHLGMNIDHVVTFGISPELNGYTPARSAQLFQQLRDELAAQPGVTDVAVSLVPILSGSNWGNSVVVQGFKKTPDTDDNSRFNEVSPGYFHAMGIPLLSGREFTTADGPHAPLVAIVNEAFAKKFGLGRGAVGKFMGMRDSINMEIVGLVKNSNYSDVKQEAPPVFAIPYRQDSTLGSAQLYVRTAGDPVQVIRAIPRVMAKLDRNLPVEELKTLPQQVNENVFLDRMISILSAAFAALATLLAAIGLYGVLAYSVAQRTREIGVRMALGAQGGDVRRMVLKQVGAMTLIGGVIGIAGALALGRGARSLLFGIDGHDPVVIAVSTVLLALVALVAGYIPARRAAKIDPMVALRYE